MRDPEIYIDDDAADRYNLILVKTMIFKIPSLHKQFICRSRFAKSLFYWDNPYSSISRILYEAVQAGITHINHKIIVSPIVDPETFLIRHVVIFSGIRILVPLEDSNTVRVLDKLSA